MRNVLALILALASLSAAAQAQSPAPSVSPAPSASAATAAAENPVLTKLARDQITAWERGRIDRSAYTTEANAQITSALISDVASKMRPLGAPSAFRYVGPVEFKGLSVLQYEATWPQFTLVEYMSVDAAGKINFIYFTPKQ